jgi:hypothetical protein
MIKRIPERKARDDEWLFNAQSFLWLRVIKIVSGLPRRRAQREKRIVSGGGWLKG